MSSVSHISPVEELATFLARGPSPFEIASFRLSQASLARATELMDKNKDGTLTPEESHELDRLILLDDVIGLIQSQVPLSSAGGESNQHPDPHRSEPQATDTPGA